ncbi:MAG: GntR family transcriptional regulator [Dehalococcoidia bacterium]|nr:GntR family transcriptional regulator [Dehalococcoidia bacterium]
MTGAAEGLVPIRTPGKFTDAAYVAIRTGIRMGRILPGARLHEAELAGQLGTSKTPVREALHRLIAEGLATATTGGKSAVYVTSLSDQEIIDLYEARVIIEPPLARMAAVRASDEGVARLRDLLKSFDAALRDDDIYSLMELDSLIHETIASMSGNHALAQARERLDNSIAIARVTSVQKSRYKTSELALREHRQICEAIADHEAETAERRMAEHINRRRDGLIALLAGSAQVHLSQNDAHS